MSRVNDQRERMHMTPWNLRIGIHTGGVMAGIVGRSKFTYDIWGDAVNVASRMESTGEAGKIVLSDTTYHLVRDQFACTHRGPIEAKNRGVLETYVLDRALNSGVD